MGKKQDSRLKFDVDSNGCWNVTSHYADTTGYPSWKVTAHGKRYVERIFRTLYQRQYGPVPPGTVLRHTCDNRKCANPSHIIPGTHADNVADRVARDRSAKGTGNGRAKLTEADVRDIMQVFRKSPAFSIGSIAKHYGVDPKSIRQIINGQTWRHVTLAEETHAAA